MNSRFWSAGSVLAIGLIISSGLLVYFLTQRWWVESVPAFSELTVVSGQIEEVKAVDRYDSDNKIWDWDVYITLQTQPRRYLYWEPNEYEVYEALKEGGTATLWVDPLSSEVWQVATDDRVVSSYQARFIWGQSNRRLGKIFVSFLIVSILGFLPAWYLYRRLYHRVKRQKMLTLIAGLVLILSGVLLIALVWILTQDRSSTLVMAMVGTLTSFGGVWLIHQRVIKGKTA
jgi:hypothetical protein